MVRAAGVSIPENKVSPPTRKQVQATDEVQGCVEEHDFVETEINANLVTKRKQTQTRRKKRSVNDCSLCVLLT
jgi:hypothetical protein